MQFITDLNGVSVEVTDLDAAIRQAQNCVSACEEGKRLREMGDTRHGIYYPKRHQYWCDLLSKLQKLE